jgi:hypothetical protein
MFCRCIQSLPLYNAASGSTQRTTVDIHLLLIYIYFLTSCQDIAYTYHSLVKWQDFLFLQDTMHPRRTPMICTLPVLCGDFLLLVVSSPLSKLCNNRAHPGGDRGVSHHTSQWYGWNGLPVSSWVFSAGSSCGVQLNQGKRCLRVLSTS